MNRGRAALVLASASLLTGGCVAAAIPVVAGGVVARGKLRDREPGQAERRQAAAQPARVAAAVPSSESAVRVTALTELPPPSGAAGDEPGPYRPLNAYLEAQAAKRARGEPLRSVVLETGATLDAPRFAACDDKPPAVIFDLDEDPAKASDPDARWRRWQGDARDAIAAQPGALDAIGAARRGGFAVIFGSARSPDGAAGVTAALDQVGLGPAEAGKTLYLRGSAPADAMRRSIAERHCVVALIGDEPGDFSDLLAAIDADAMQSSAMTDTKVAPLWGAGWFLLPNVVRSTAIPSTNPSGGN